MHRGMQRVITGPDCLSCKAAVIIIIRIVIVDTVQLQSFYTYLLFWIWFGQRSLSVSAVELHSCNNGNLIHVDGG